MECHSLQTFHWHCKAYDVTHCYSYFSVILMLEDMELNHKGQQYTYIHIDLLSLVHKYSSSLNIIIYSKTLNAMLDNAIGL